MVEPDPLAGREILIEEVRLGDLIEVRAIDAETGLEAVISGPARASRHDLETLAIRKLAFLWRKRNGGAAGAPVPRSGRGILA